MEVIHLMIVVLEEYPPAGRKVAAQLDRLIASGSADGQGWAGDIVARASRMLLSS